MFKELLGAGPPPADECPAAAAPPASGECLHAQPEKPKGKIMLIEVRGGSDKGADGHRRDTIPICNGLIKKGWCAMPMFYDDEHCERMRAELSTCDGFIARVNPGTYAGVTQSKLDQMLRDVASKGVAPMSHPDVMIKMGAKDAL
eukprot:1195374-Prorocentrum_minimum.AAC.10